MLILFLLLFPVYRVFSSFAQEMPSPFCHYIPNKLNSSGHVSKTEGRKEEPFTWSPCTRPRCVYLCWPWVTKAVMLYSQQKNIRSLHNGVNISESLLGILCLVHPRILFDIFMDRARWWFTVFLWSACTAWCFSSRDICRGCVPSPNTCNSVNYSITRQPLAPAFETIQILLCAIPVCSCETLPPNSRWAKKNALIRAEKLQSKVIHREIFINCQKTTPLLFVIISPLTTSRD